MGGVALLQRCVRLSVWRELSIVILLLILFPLQAHAIQKPDEVKSEIASIEKEIRLLEERKRQLLAKLPREMGKPKTQPIASDATALGFTNTGDSSARLAKPLQERKKPKERSPLTGSVALGFTYTGGERGVLTGTSGFDFQYRLPRGKIVVEEHLDIKDSVKSRKSRHQLSASYHRTINDRLTGFGELETIYNSGSHKQNFFSGINYQLLRGEPVDLSVEFGAGSQYRGKPHFALTQRTRMGIDFWGVARLKADMRWIFSDDKPFKLELDEKRIRWDFSISRKIFGAVALETFYRNLRDKRGEDYASAGIRLRYKRK